MENILNITNGDCAVEVMEKAEIPGVFLPWRDVLHDGPVPKGLSLKTLSQVRAKFIASRGWGESENIKQSFIERDELLKSFKEFEKVILWFEHDLYDQLQVLQILDWFHENNKVKPSLLELSQGKKLMLPSKGQELTITSFGLDVLAGKRNWLEVSTLDRWLGGVHLQANNVWYWNSDSDSIVRGSGSYFVHAH